MAVQVIASSYTDGPTLTAAAAASCVPTYFPTTLPAGYWQIGRIWRVTYREWLASLEEERRREREAAARSATAAIVPEEAPAARSAYFRQSAALASAIQKARGESEALRVRIAALEAQALRSRAAKRAALEHRLLLAQQSLTLVAVQEAVLLQEIEAIDVAFIAAAVLDVTRH